MKQRDSALSNEQHRNRTFDMFAQQDVGTAGWGLAGASRQLQTLCLKDAKIAQVLAFQVQTRSTCLYTAKGLQGGAWWASQAAACFEGCKDSAAKGLQGLQAKGCRDCRAGLGGPLRQLRTLKDAKIAQ
eukprot:1153799-Pelagomonas_calceolata.AAC.1